MGYDIKSSLSVKNMFHRFYALLLTCALLFGFGCHHASNSDLLVHTTTSYQNLSALQENYFAFTSGTFHPVLRNPADLHSDDTLRNESLTLEISDKPKVSAVYQEEVCHPEELIGTLWVSVPEPELIEDPLIEEHCADSAYPWCSPLFEEEYVAYLEERKLTDAETAMFPNFVAPVKGGLILRGMQKPRKGRRGHYGLDIISATEPRRGTPINAVEDGVVVRVGKGRRYGYYTVLYHQNGLFSLYSHTLKNTVINVGQEVRRGETIALMGKTGNARGYHLHFELIDLREYWESEESIDEFIEQLCLCSLQTSELNRFHQQLFAKKTKKDPLPGIPGLAFAKWVNGRLVAVPIENAKTQAQAAAK